MSPTGRTCRDTLQEGCVMGESAGRGPRLRDEVGSVMCSCRGPPGLARCQGDEPTVPRLCFAHTRALLSRRWRFCTLHCVAKLAIIPRTQSPLLPFSNRNSPSGPWTLGQGWLVRAEQGAGSCLPPLPSSSCLLPGARPRARARPAGQQGRGGLGFSCLHPRGAPWALAGPAGGRAVLL